MSKVNHYVQYSIKYERNQALRNEAIKIHHLKPMFSIKREIKVNPQKDLVPLCSNCHKMIHRNTKQPLTIKELTEIVNHNS
ncbi:hypothetical protein [Staphylococcus hominis]|uniref:hypothetical protein n=1 Tax=Staphylococcus hominis TaxID=1290 RepID=UPI0021B6ACA4|nr:hypothetical protein [Staphylococcus hominis]